MLSLSEKQYNHHFTVMSSRLWLLEPGYLEKEQRFAATANFLVNKLTALLLIGDAYQRMSTVHTQT